MAANIDEISIRYSEDGIDVVKELDKQVLSKGAWTTIIFKYQDWDRSKQVYGPEKYSIRRYRAQAEKVVEVLQGWLAEGEGD